MLDNIYEWERLVHPTPTDEMIISRKAIVASILTSFDSKKEVNEAIRLVSAAVTGLNPSIPADVDYAALLTKVTKEHQQAFPSSLAENKLDLQLSASLVVGEVLTRKQPKGAWKESIDLMAGLTAAAHGMLASAEGMHLKLVQDALVAQANTLLARKANQIRERPEYEPEALDHFSAPGDLTSFWNGLKPILENTLSSMARASSIDRDELEVLWWLYNDSSTTFSKKLSELNAYEVAFSTPIELIDRGLCPAPMSLKNIIHGLVTLAEKRAKPTNKTLKSLFGGWTSAIITSLSPQDDGVRVASLTCPKVLPLTWIANKVAEAGVVAGWEEEFGARTTLNTTRRVTPSVIAEQVFAERTVQRLLLPLCGE